MNGYSAHEKKEREDKVDAECKEADAWKEKGNNLYKQKKVYDALAAYDHMCETPLTYYFKRICSRSFSQKKLSDLLKYIGDVLMR